MKRYNNREQVFAPAKPMKFNTFNTERITGKIKTFADTTSFPENVDINIDLDGDMLAFSFKPYPNVEVHYSHDKKASTGTMVESLGYETCSEQDKLSSPARESIPTDWT